EVADVVAIHKADLPGADRVEAQVLATLALSGAPAPPVLRVSGRTGAGVAELWDIVAALPLRRGTGGADRGLVGLARGARGARVRGGLGRRAPQADGAGGARAGGRAAGRGGGGCGPRGAGGRAGGVSPLLLPEQGAHPPRSPGAETATRKPKSLWRDSGSAR